MKPRRVLLAGATGSIGRAVAREFSRRGDQVLCLARPRSGPKGVDTAAQTRERLAPAEVRFVDVTDPAALAAELEGETFDVVVSCLASRSGGIDDSRKVDLEANLHLLELARSSGARHFLLLSAICVQRPRLAFQHAKLAFEKVLRSSELTWSIIRPTAFFKSLSGQIERVRRGRPFLVFGDGQLTSCTPISDADLARFIAECLDDVSRHHQVLPIGGPGPPLTPLQQGALLFKACGRAPKYRRVPVALLDVIIAVLGALSRVFPSLSDKAEYARIGRYYATESMLVFDAQRGVYDGALTPCFGTETLGAFYEQQLRERT